MSELTLPDLPYAYNALEPYISEEIMTLHHKKHHQTYVNGYNAASKTLAGLVPDPTTARQQIALQSAIKFNGDAIDRDFGSFDNFKKEFTAASLGIQGSGWGWLVLIHRISVLTYILPPTRIPLPPYVPLFGVDMWEHAFYLQYKNVKPDVISLRDLECHQLEEAEKRLNEGLSSKL
ncbi:superoxide dismutase, Fe-Mn family [Ceratobasidium sp. AG-Ba]|nr:superoxide dismutase, Fe-Mn family [Ceratobasidium sp. AG-Ba]